RRVFRFNANGTMSCIQPEDDAVFALLRMETTMKTKLLGFVLWSMALACCLQAQSTTGSILGDVTDSSGARLPGASVRLVNEGTGAAREVLTTEVGSSR